MMRHFVKGTMTIPYIHHGDHKVFEFKFQEIIRFRIDEIEDIKSTIFNFKLDKYARGRIKERIKEKSVHELYDKTKVNIESIFMMHK